MEVDWDLHAVVRGCTLAASADPPPPPQQQQQQPCFFSIQQADELMSDELGFVGDSFFSDNTLDQLFRFDLLKTVDDAPQPAPIDRPVLISPLLVEPKREEIQKQQVSSCNLFQPRNSTSSSTPPPPPPLRSKRRRKNQMKKVCQVPAEGLSSDDTWSWRKYGQKPIKGSPYPRGYYRCSSSKGCPARKQVERNRSDPNMFIVTYSAEHNHPAPTHRNSLAGTTRNNHHHNKLNSLPVTVPSKLTITTTTASSSSVPTSDDDVDVQQSIKTEENQLDDMMQGFEVNEEEKNVLLLDDDFFDGLDCEIGGDVSLSWLPNSTIS
ncbi:unnamed protein product [Rhodiola kirilowii]